MAKRIEVVGAVLVHDYQVFAAKRGPGKSMAGCWEFPGGKVEAGETPQEALVRELREELRIEARVGEFLTTTVHGTGSAVIELSTYLCEIIAGSPALMEHTDSRWVAVSELAGLEWAPADIPTVELLQERFM